MVQAKIAYAAKLLFDFVVYVFDIHVYFKFALIIA